MKHRGLTGLVASSVGLLLLGFACVDADIPNVSNGLRDALAETYANAGAAPIGAGNGGSASTPNAGAGGAPDDGGGDEPTPDPSGGAAGSSMAGVAGGEGEGAAGAGGAGGGEACNGFDLLQRTCGLSGCHAPENAPFSGFAASEEAARSFIGREGTTSCSGQGPLLDPDDPANSIVVLKASGEAECGGAMPPVGGPEPLTDDEIDCVVEWIGSLAE